MLTVGFTPSAGVMQNLYCNKNKSNTPSFGDGLLIIKPEAFHKSASILKKIAKNGYEVTDITKRQLTKDEVTNHYKELYLNAQKMLKEGNDFLVKVYDRVIENMLKGKVTTAIIKGDDAKIAAFKEFTGATSYKKRDPKSLRGQIEREMIKEWNKQGKTPDEIEKLRDAYTFTHASDTNFFPGTTIKNGDYEIANLYPKNLAK